MRRSSLVATTALTAFLAMTARASAETERPGFEAMAGASAGAALLYQSKDQLSFVDCLCQSDRITAVGPSVAGRLGILIPDSFVVSEDLAVARLSAAATPTHIGLEVETLGLLVSPQYVHPSGARVGLGFGFTLYWARGSDPISRESFVHDSQYYRLLALGGYDWKIGGRWSLGAELGVGFAASASYYEGTALDAMLGIAATWK